MSLSDWLPEAAIRTHVNARNWREAVTLCGEALVAAGTTSAAYTEEMIQTVEKHGPYIVIAPGLALAHSRPSPAVHRAGLSWVTLASPVEFGSQANDPVDLIIGLAALDHDGHIEMIAALASAISDPTSLARLRAAGGPTEVRTIFDEIA
ncbi:MAG: PTS sugar transporter subunit IIA [Beutenbergiaceae bacterium]